MLCHCQAGHLEPASRPLPASGSYAATQGSAPTLQPQLGLRWELQCPSVRPLGLDAVGWWNYHPPLPGQLGMMDAGEKTPPGTPSCSLGSVEGSPIGSSWVLAATPFPVFHAGFQERKQLQQRLQRSRGFLRPLQALLQCLGLEEEV